MPENVVGLREMTSTQTFFFYDLETSGLNAREDRIMQFAGQRTDMELNPIGEPNNILVKLNEDTLPSPDALLVTGISPQQTLQDGISEAEFAELLVNEICTPDTITVGFNNIRFDDEFVRHLLWRTFREPYEWCWKDGRSRWDLLDVVRLTRALRPDGIIWPEVDGVAVNKLELLTKANGIDHVKAHDALSDVEALIAVTRLIREKQPQLYEYLLKMRDKNQVKQLVALDAPQPFVYASGRYDAAHHKTTIAYPLAKGRNGNVVVYDLRIDPSLFVQLSEQEVVAKLSATYEQRRQDGFVAIPVKELQYNRAPAVAPTGVLEAGDGWQRLELTADEVRGRIEILRRHPHLARYVADFYADRPAFAKAADPEAGLYDGFLQDRDRLRVETVRNASEAELARLKPDFSDSRLSDLFLRYKARNYPKTLSGDEVVAWETWRGQRVQRQLPHFVARLNDLARTADDEPTQYILQELQLWAESVMPSDVSDQ